MKTPSTVAPERMPRRTCGTLAGCRMHDRHEESWYDSCRTAWKAIQAARCGTPEGYGMHLDAAEVPCERCRSAMRKHLRAGRPVTP